MTYLKKLDLLFKSFPVTDQYPFDLNIFRNTESIKFKKKITFFIGENGTGKSTLLKAIAHRCGIHIWQDEAASYSRVTPNPYEQDLYRYIDIHWADAPVPGSFFGSQIFSHFAKNLEQWAANDKRILDYFGGKSLLTQSHGQSLMSFFSSRYSRKGVYLLDEPETALSPESLIKLLNLLNKVAKQGHAQFIIATHSPFLLACPGSQILSFNDETITPIAYEDTSYYKLYKAFINAPEDFIHRN